MVYRNLSRTSKYCRLQCEKFIGLVFEFQSCVVRRRLKHITILLMALNKNFTAIGRFTNMALCSNFYMSSYVLFI